MVATAFVTKQDPQRTSQRWGALFAQTQVVASQEESAIQKGATSTIS